MRKFFLILVVVIWTVSVGIGFVWMTDYSTRPGIPADVSVKLPPNIFSESEYKMPKLVLFIHPQCPCTAATFTELEKIVASTQGLAKIKVIFYRPNDKPVEWIETAYWRRSKNIPDVEISSMTEEEIEKFGVITSGQTLLYDAEGNLLFSGGITSARATEGDNTGRQIVETYLHKGKILSEETPVFGCSLTSSVIIPR